MGKTSKMQENDTQKLVIFTGKGGVGKSLLSLAYAYGLAKYKAKEKQKVLHIELNEQSFVAAMWPYYKAEFKAQALKTNKISKVYCSYWSWVSCLKEYLAHLLKIQSLVNLFFSNSISSNIIQLAPGLSDLAILGKFTSGLRRHGPQIPFDYLVMDAPASGHFLAMLKAPKALAGVAPVGMMVEQSKSIMQTLKSKNTSFYIVSLCEDLALQEAKELQIEMHREFNIEAKIIVNKILLNIPELNKSFEQNTFSNWLVQKKAKQEKLNQDWKDFISMPWLTGNQEPEEILQKIAEVFNQNGAYDEKY